MNLWNNVLYYLVPVRHTPCYKLSVSYISISAICSYAAIRLHAAIFFRPVLNLTALSSSILDHRTYSLREIQLAITIQSILQVGQLTIHDSELLANIYFWYTCSFLLNRWTASKPTGYDMLSLPTCTVSIKHSVSQPTVASNTVIDAVTRGLERISDLAFVYRA